MNIKALALLGLAWSLGAQADLGAKIEEGLAAVRKGKIQEADQKFFEAQSSLGEVENEADRARLGDDLEQMRKALGRGETAVVEDRAVDAQAVLGQDPDNSRPPRHGPPKQEPRPQPKPQPPRHEPPRHQPPRHDPPRYEPPRHEPPRYEPPRHYPPRPYPPRPYPPYPPRPYPPAPYPPAPPYQPPYYERLVQCDSLDGYLYRCDAGVWIETIRVESQYSHAWCNYGTSYGVEPSDRRIIWVANGCRALFRVTYR